MTSFEVILLSFRGFNSQPRPDLRFGTVRSRVENLSSDPQSNERHSIYSMVGYKRKPRSLSPPPPLPSRHPLLRFQTPSWTPIRNLNAVSIGTNEPFLLLFSIDWERISSFRIYSNQGRKYNGSYGYTYTTKEGDTYSFLGLDMCPRPGAGRPFNFLGQISKVRRRRRRRNSVFIFVFRSFRKR